MTCKWCNKNKIKKGEFRCDSCASTAIMNPYKRNLPLGATLWKNKSGSYIPKPSQ